MGWTIVGTVFELNRRGKFDLESARNMLGLVFKITSEIDEQFQLQMAHISSARNASDLDRVTVLEAEVQTIIQKWENKMTKLGLEPKGIWLVDFDAGDGFYCWKYPEMDIKFWHGYNDGYTGRKPISNPSPSNNLNQ